VSLVLRWRLPERRITARWRGPGGMIEAVGREPATPIAAIVGPPGPAGGVLRLDAPLAATWILPHPLGRIPATQVYLADGEAVAADVEAGPSHITVTHAAPCQGFVLLI
jgi:hypothetical protein